MKAFAELYRELDASTSTAHKTAVLARWFADTDATDPESAAWAAWVLAGGKLRQAVPTAALRAWAGEAAGIEPWLFEASYASAGDLAETIAHLLPDAALAADAAAAPAADAGLAHWMRERIAPLRGLDPAAQQAAVRQAWRELDAEGRFMFIKLIGGGLRVGVSRVLVQRAIGQAFGLDPKRVAERMMGFTDAKRAPTVEGWRAIVSADAPTPAQRSLQPYPFFLAHPLERPVETLGDRADWLVEWKFDGIRAQVVRRAGGVAIWTRGEELATERFPEVAAEAARWAEGTVVDGELLAWLPEAAAPAPFALLQRRIQRRALTPRLLRECPVVLRAYDLLEDGGADLRERPLHERRSRLDQLAAEGLLTPSPPVQGASWSALAEQRAEARARGVEGLMLKPLDGRYGIGRTREAGAWWKWKVEPLVADAVLVYAQAGHGRRANLHTDYTFAVWNRTPASPQEAQAVLDAIARREPPPEDPAALRLVPFAKAYSGLTDDEFRHVDRIVRRTTVETFGPVRSVVPSLVFEIGFEGLQPSPRHKSGIATRFPRMLRLRDDKPLWEADTLATLQALMAGEPAGTTGAQCKGPDGWEPAGP